MKALDVPTASAAARGPSAGVARPDSAMRVIIRGRSAVTPFGGDGDTWHGLLAGRFISDHARCPFLTGASRAKQLAQRAATGAVAGLVTPDAAVVVGTSKGSVEDWLSHAPASAGLGDIAEHVAASLGVVGPRLTVSAACASGLQALIRGAMMLRAGAARQVVVVGVEASVHPLFLGSFQRLGVLAKPGEWCRPFDLARTGFYMSAAAAAVLLQAGDSDGDAVGSICIDRFALGGDATHLTGGDPELRTLRHLLARVIGPRPVDLVHAYGTGTPTNDEAELAAVESALSPQPTRPGLYSHKGALGHSLGAAGLLSVVLNCHVHATGTIPPNVQTRDPLPSDRLCLSTSAVRRPVRRSITIAAGFGGATAVVGLTSL